MPELVAIDGVGRARLVLWPDDGLPLPPAIRYQRRPQPGARPGPTDVAFDRCDDARLERLFDGRPVYRQREKGAPRPRPAYLRLAPIVTTQA